MKAPSPQEAALLLRTHFGLDAPVSPHTFRMRYRALALDLHPDRAGPGATAAFQNMQNAYERIIQCAPIFQCDHGKASLHDNTVDGTSLATLGLGLGPNVNAQECSKCKGSGYTTTWGQKWVVCDDCDEEGWPLRTCPQCKGTCGFTSLEGEHVMCWTCRDVGKVRVPQRVVSAIRRKQEQKYRRYGTRFFDFFDSSWLCASCRGTHQKTVSDKEQPNHQKCGHCHGAGEVRIYNPVIPKGRLAHHAR
jgi:DnaJ-class molecular chaperone